MSQLNVTTLKHESAGVDNITLDANGRVGVGTSNPSLPLHIFAPSENVALFQRNGASPALVRFRDNTTTTDPYIAAYGNDLAFGLYGGGERMRIDSAGRVTMPNQPSFRVSKAGSAANQNDYVIFDTVYHNIGGHYSTSTGRFTAPIAGRYLFCVINNMGAANQADTFLRINGSNALGVEYDPATGGTAYWLGLSIPVVLDLNANDYIQVYINGTPATGVEGIPWNSFSGHLIG